MSKFAFCYPSWRKVEPAEWLEVWAHLYGEWGEPEYFALMDNHEKQGKLLGEDFEQIGRWKEDCLKVGHGSWKTGTPRAYDVWMQAKSELTGCPAEDGLASFLKCWSEKTFFAGTKNGKKLRYRFGLSRATTLLHFVSGGKYPIFDANVANAMKLLGRPIEETIEGYLRSFCPLFSEIAALCGTSGIRGLRKLDTALFSYGSDLRLSKFDLGSC